MGMFGGSVRVDLENHLIGKRTQVSLALGWRVGR